MSKTKEFIAISLGFLVFLVCFIRLGFLANQIISNTTILYAFVVYIFTILSLSILFDIDRIITRVSALSAFIFYCVLLYGISMGVSSTFDTSWDGQGYNQTAVIALANGWNPMIEPNISLQQRLPSQIFSESYPSALWEIQAAVYAFTGTLQSAKVIGVAFGIIAGMLAFILARYLSFKKHIAAVISILVVIQPVFILQLLTFMQDGTVYQLLIIAAVSLVIIAMSSTDHWAIGTFVMSELLLVSSKYSNLPLALILGIIFLLLIVNRFLNKSYNKSKMYYAFALVFLIFLSLIFSSLPYVRNMIYHGTPFYPTNVPELMGSVTYNNVPSNLKEHSKAGLLFYGIFSKAQSIASGDPRSPENIAVLKLPFSFSISELRNSAFLYNNRVGAGGPLYSGLVIYGMLVIFVAALSSKNRDDRYAIYTSSFGVIIILLSTLLLPTPNLMRYAIQLQLIPFAIILPIYTMRSKKHVSVLIHLLILATLLNTTIFAY